VSDKGHGAGQAVPFLRLQGAKRLGSSLA